MTWRFADILNARLEELVSEGYEIRRIFAAVPDIERLFVELGDAAVLLDCDPDQDKAWFGPYELVPAAEGEHTMIMYCRGDDCWITDLVMPEELAEPGKAA